MDATMDTHVAAIAEPATMYERPFDVLRDMTLTRGEKIEILHRWLTDVVTNQDAPEADQSDRVCAVTKALQFLGAPIDVS